jgi:hypothetical protein
MIILLMHGLKTGPVMIFPTRFLFYVASEVAKASGKQDEIEPLEKNIRNCLIIM